jgi:endonuclease III
VTSKTQKIESLAMILQEQHINLPNPPERTVLAHLIYAALLENTLFELADSAFTILENYFIDWNEIRVSTVNELADTFPMLPDPLAAGERVRRALQGVFEQTYMFDLEELRKKGKNLCQAVEFLNSIPGCTRFMIDYTTQVAFGGHVIPLDEASLRIFRLLDLTQVNKEGTRENVAGLERAIQKKSGLAFALQLHHFAAGFYNDPELTELRSILKPIDPEAENRSWTPPVLTIPKPVAKPPIVKPPILPLPAMPFVAPDEDDFDEDHVGTEIEFVSDEIIYQHDSTNLSEKTDKKNAKSNKSTTSSAEKKKTPKREKTSVKKKIEPTVVVSNSFPPIIPKPLEKQPEPVQEKTKKTTSKNNKTLAKSDTTSSSSPASSSPTSSSSAQIVNNSNEHLAEHSTRLKKKSTEKENEKSNNEKNDTETTGSTIKQLVKKKPK